MFYIVTPSGNMLQEEGDTTAVTGDGRLVTSINSEHLSITKASGT